MRDPGSLARLFAPRAVALVGVPGDPARPGARPLHHLRRHGYPGRLYLVNPRHREIAGLAAFPSLAALPEPPDVAWIGLPAAQAAEAVRACGRAGVPFAVVLGAGFAEAGETGGAVQDALRAAARESGVRLVGPNTIGFVNAWDRVALTFSTLGEIDTLREGPLAVLSQSGGLGGSLVNQALDRRIGVGLFVSTGNEADLELADYLEWIVADGRARAVACLVEQVRAPERFARAAQDALARGIAVVALKLGASETGARAARSHTGALVGRRDAWRAWARTAGVLEAADPGELIETAAFLARTPPLAGSRLGLVTSSGGIAVALVDALEPRGFGFPALAAETVARIGALLPGYASVMNPVDVTAGLPDETFGEVLLAILRDPNVDAAVVPLTMATAERGRARAVQVVRAVRGVRKPLAVCWIGGSLVQGGFQALDEAEVPLFHSIPGCAAALGAALEHQRLEARRSRVMPQVPRLPEITVALPAEPGPLAWETTRALLGAAGLPLVAETLVRSDAEARYAATGLRYPVAVKLVGPLHKTEAHGVRLGVADAEGVLAAVRELLPRGVACAIQAMAEGEEVLVGALRDPVLGPFVLVAPGGVRAELYGAGALRPAPVGLDEAEAMLAELKGLEALLAGHRGQAPADRRALAEVIVRVSALAARLGSRLGELDLNPVLVSRAGATLVDWRLVLES